MSQDDKTCSVAKLAELFDLTPRRIQQLAADGIIPKAARGQYDMAGAVRGYNRYLQEQAERSAGPADFNEERARLMKARADLAEMEAGQKRGELIAAEDVEAAWVQVLTLLRTRLLGIPDQLAPIMHKTGTITEKQRIIKAAVREALDDLAGADVTTELPDEGDAGARGIGHEIAGEPSAAA